MATLWLDVLDEAIRTCGAHGASDLAQRLRRKRARLLDPRLRVLVVGEANHGKSRLVNALLNAPVCAVGDDLTTTVPTVVEYAPEAVATRVDGAAGTGTAEPVPVPLGYAGALATPPGEPVHLVVGVPREVLRAGLV